MSISESLDKETIGTCSESGTILPFLDYFNKESRLYQVMTTKPGENMVRINNEYNCDFM